LFAGFWFLLVEFDARVLGEREGVRGFLDFHDLVDDSTQLASSLNM
jgi:hypothetical protein